MANLLIVCRCGKAIPVAEKDRGKKIKCRDCGRVMRAGRREGIATRMLNTAEMMVAERFRRGRRRRRRRTERTGLSKEHRYDRLFGRIAWGYLAAMTLLAIVIWTLGDAWWPGTILLFMGRWVFFLPLVVLIPVAFGIRAAHIIPLLLSALVILGPINGFRSGWRRLLPQKPGKHVRVVSFNTDGGAEVAARLGEILDGWQPDILALQECGSELAEMSRKFDQWKHHDIRGLCLMTTFDILEAKVMDRSVLAQINESDAGVGGSGDVVRYKLRLPDSTVMTFTHLHLETPRKGLDEVAHGSLNLGRLKENTLIRETESSLARRWVNEGQDPMVIAGDFNTPVESRIFQRYWGSFADAFSRVGIGFGWTKDNGWIQTRIDHVLYGPGWAAEGVYVDPPLRSDHRPLIVDLRLLDK